MRHAPNLRIFAALVSPLLEFDSVDGYRYTVDWSEVFQMDGDRIVWKNRFEIHVDQAVANVFKKEKLKKAAG